ncbi:MAG: serine/threonine-protein kinase, partial [Myxococcota bacterium]|nr:serine/threonine-protein kinase [Myxococcota bacterium]
DREAQIVAALDHPNIVRVFDFERAYGTRFTVMERLEGEQLEDLIYKGQRLSWSRIRRILFETASALQYSHDRGLIHRDVKPSNIFITRNEQTKLLDFGISVHKDNSEAKNKARLGSPCYMPPEQILGEPLDGRSDLYALGITAYEMVVGEVPFNESDIRALLRRQVREKTPDVRELVPDCPTDIAEFIQLTTAKKREERFPDCVAAIQSLSQRNVSEPLIRAHRVKLSIDYGDASVATVNQAIAQLEATLRSHQSVTLKVTRRGSV